MFDIDKIKKDIKQIERERGNRTETKKGLTTLLNEAKGKRVKVHFMDGEIIYGILQKFSLYEIEIDNKILWKQYIKYIEILDN